jgi:hypothetical protein
MVGNKSADGFAVILDIRSLAKQTAEGTISGAERTQMTTGMPSNDNTEPNQTMKSSPIKR